MQDNKDSYSVSPVLDSLLELFNKEGAYPILKYYLPYKLSSIDAHYAYKKAEADALLAGKNAIEAKTDAKAAYDEVLVIESLPAIDVDTLIAYVKDSVFNLVDENKHIIERLQKERDFQPYREERWTMEYNQKVIDTINHYCEFIATHVKRHPGFSSDKLTSMNFEDFFENWITAFTMKSKPSIAAIALLHVYPFLTSEPPFENITEKVAKTIIAKYVKQPSKSAGDQLSRKFKRLQNIVDRINSAKKSPNLVRERIKEIKWAIDKLTESQPKAKKMAGEELKILLNLRQGEEDLPTLMKGL